MLIIPTNLLNMSALTMVENASYCCIPQPHCKLCRFRLEEGELVVAAIDDRRISSEFPFFQNTTFYDDEISGIKFHMCCRSTCRLRGRRSACFHGKCYDFRLYTVSPKFLATTNYSFRPPIVEERRRTDHMLRILTKRVQVSWTKGLPDELCRMIGGFLLRECAVITAQELAVQKSAASSILDLSQDVYVCYVVIDGIRYVRSLRNASRLTVEPGEELLLDAQIAPNLRNIHIGEDHLGIRHIQILSSGNVSSKPELSLPGLWWRQLSEPCGISRISIRTDGLKVRNIFISKEQSTLPHVRIYWSIPAPTATIIDLVSLQCPQNIPNGLRMSLFECNAPDTTGYSVATDGLSTATIHSHSQSLDLSFYKEVDSFFSHSMVWIYMPIDHGEYLTKICRRSGVTHIGSKSLVLMFITNRGRITLFGCYMPPPSLKEDYQLDCMHTPPKTPSQIYFNEWDSIPAANQVRYLGFECPEPAAPQPYPKSLVPMSSYPQTTYNELWFYSCCSMKGVIEITLCVDKTVCHRPIIGMLLTYNDKHRACVGQFRLDWALKPIGINQTGNLHIGIRDTKKGFPYVAYIDIRSPAERSSSIWLDVCWNGTLEWSFSHRRCKLLYKGD